MLAGTAHAIGTEASWNARIAAVAEHGIASIAETVLKGWVHARFRPTAIPILSATARCWSDRRSRAMSAPAAALRDADLTQSTRALAIPVIALAGDADGSTPPDLVRRHGAIVPGADFRLIADAGHIRCVEQPDDVAGLIGGFLTEIGYAAEKNMTDYVSTRAPRRHRHHHHRQSAGQRAVLPRAGAADAARSSRSRRHELRAIVLVCAGRTFIAGADINEFGKPTRRRS